MRDRLLAVAVVLTVAVVVLAAPVACSSSESATESADSVPTASTAGGCVPQGVQPVTIMVEAAGNTYEALVYMPPNGDDGGPRPAVLNWHGLGSNGSQQAVLSAYPALADREGFVVVHPTGVAGGDGLNMWELSQFDQPGRDDVAMASALIDALIADFCVDPDRIYTTGMSNGGYFSALLVCELADRIAAAVPVAGLSHPEGCQPARPVPMMAFHGTADEVVPFAGGHSVLADSARSLTTGAADGADDGGDGAAMVDDFFNQSMLDEFAEFAADFGCDPDPTRTEIEAPGDSGLGLNGPIITHTWTGCDDDVPLVFHEIEGGGHTWPGSLLAVLAADRIGPTTLVVDATSDGWAFMQNHHRP